MKLINKAFTLGTVFLLVTASHITSAAPLFTQCSSLPGTNSSASGGCNALITNTNSGLTIQIDPLASGFGGEDSFVGVVNNASTTLFSVHLSSTTDIFAFDGDGTFAGGAYSDSSITFTGISADFMSGTINFVGGLAPGASIAFELEENLSAAGLPPPVIGNALPEPSTIALFGLGLLTLRKLRRNAPRSAEKS